MIEVAASAEAMRVLLQVANATLPAPSSDAEPTDVLERGQKMIAAREPILELLKSTLGAERETLADDEVAREVLSEIQARDASWLAAMERAKHLLSGRMVAMRRLRRGTY